MLFLAASDRIANLHLGKMKKKMYLESLFLCSDDNATKVGHGLIITAHFQFDAHLGSPWSMVRRTVGNHLHYWILYLYLSISLSLVLFSFLACLNIYS